MSDFIFSMCITFFSCFHYYVILFLCCCRFTGVAGITIIVLLVVPIIYLLNLHPATSELIASLAFGFGSMLALILLFFPKWFSIHAFVAKATESQRSVRAILSGKGDAQVAASDPTSTGPAATIAGAELINRLCHGKKTREKLDICQLQMQLFHAEILKLQESLFQKGSSDASQYSFASSIPVDGMNTFTTADVNGVQPFSDPELGLPSSVPSSQEAVSSVTKPAHVQRGDLQLIES